MDKKWSTLLRLFCVTLLFLLLCSTYAVASTHKLPTELTTIDDEAFYGNTSLEALELPETVSIIGFRAFANCPNLTYLGLPENVAVVPGDMLDGSDNVCVYLYEDSVAHVVAKASGWDYYVRDAAPDKPIWNGDEDAPLQVAPLLDPADDTSIIGINLYLPGIFDVPGTDGCTIFVHRQGDFAGRTYDGSCLSDEGGEWYGLQDTFEPGIYTVFCSLYRIVDGKTYDGEDSTEGYFTLLDETGLSAEVGSVSVDSSTVIQTVELTWTAVENAVEYCIERVGTDGSQYLLYLSGDSYCYTDAEVLGGVSYTYSIYALSEPSSGGGAMWSTYCYATVDVPEQTQKISYLEVQGDLSVAGGGHTLQLTAYYEPTENVHPGLVWSSSNPDIATIDANGLVTTAANVADDTSVTFTCAATDGSGLTASSTIVVKNNRSYSFKNYNIYNISNTAAYMNAWPDTMNGSWKSLVGTSKSDSSAEQMFALEPVAGTYDHYRLRVMEYGGVYVSATTSGASICSLSASTVFKVVPTGSNVCFVTTDGAYALTLGSVVSSSYSYQNFIKLASYTGSTAQQWRLAAKSATLTTNVSSISLYEGATSTITAYITSDGSENSAPLLFSSSDTSVATVSSAGVVTAQTAGTANITVRTVSGISKTIPVTVSKKDTSNLPVIEWKNTTMSVKENLAFTIPLTVTGYTARFPVSLTVSEPTLDILSCKFTSINQTLIQLGQSGAIFAVNGGHSVSTVKPNSTSRNFYATGATMNIYLGGSYLSTKGNRTVTLTLNDPTDSSYVVGANRTLTLTLVDVDARRPASKSGYTRSEYVAACLGWLNDKYPSGYGWNHPIGTVNNDNHITSGICSGAHTSTNVVRSTSWCDGTLAVYQGAAICNANQSYTSSQCMGFALKVASDVFGSTPGVGSGWTKYTSYSSAGGFQPGDYVRVKNHSFFVTGIEGSVVKVLHCNYVWDQKYSCGIVRTGDATWSNNYSTITHWQNQGIEAIYRYTGW